MAETPRGYVPLLGSERRVRPGAALTGPAAGDEQLTVTLRVRRRPGGPPFPDATTPVLTREEFARDYGADATDLDAVARFGAAHGLREVERSVARRTVKLSGTVIAASEAFGVDLGTYASAAETYRGRVGEVHIPAELEGVVEGVFGLDNRRMARRAATPDPSAPSGNIGPIEAAAGAHALTPVQVAQLYGFPAELDGSGEAIGLIEFGGGYTVSWVAQYFAGLGLSAPSLTAVGVDGVANAPDSGDESEEVILDVDVAGAVAPGAKLAVYFAPWTEQGWVDIITTAVHDATNRPSALSISWGWPENEQASGLTWTQQAIDAVSATFQEAAALGVTVFAASGDYGSDSQIGDGRAHVLYPSSDPYVTGCGGTSISNASGTSFTQSTWPSTGGGVSDIFPVPSWQASANVPLSANGGGHRGRGVPDIAGNADPQSGYTLVFGTSKPTVGGTSAVGPLYAGLVALLNQGLGRPVGYLNPFLYSSGAQGVFKDVDDGVSNASVGAPGYTSGPGWDACTGWGSVIGSALLTALEQVTAAQ